MTFNTLKEIYDHSVKAYADNVVSSMHERETLTYAMFRERVEALQQTLLEAGLSAGVVTIFARRVKLRIKTKLRST